MSLRKLTKSQKEEIAAKQHFKCAQSVENYICPLWNRNDNKGSFGEEKYHIDHIKEIWDGGDDNISNLQALCLSCHAVKTKRNTSIRNKMKEENKKLIPNVSKKIQRINLQKVFNKMNYYIEIKSTNSFVQYSPNYPDRRFVWNPINNKPLNPLILDIFEKRTIDYGGGNIITLWKYPIDVHISFEKYEEFIKEYKNIINDDFKPNIINGIYNSKDCKFNLQDIIDINKVKYDGKLTINTLSN